MWSHRTAVYAQLVHVHCMLTLGGREGVAAHVQGVVVLHDSAVRSQGGVKDPVHVEEQTPPSRVVHEGDVCPAAGRQARARVHELAVAPPCPRGGHGGPQLSGAVVEEDGGRTGKFLGLRQVEPLAQQRAAGWRVVRHRCCVLQEIDPERVREVRQPKGLRALHHHETLLEEGTVTPACWRRTMQDLGRTVVGMTRGIIRKLLVKSPVAHQASRHRIGDQHALLA
mmetsp:Transcript_88562/g.277336  ORF Transcript_88562/g.277336 Transcript_88562/m.277336 type:complete len:225 (+) Transcript_88562:325-999(+)